MAKKVSLHIDSEHYDMPHMAGSENEEAVDISWLRGKTGLITMDESYANTGSCKSAITFIDGEKGILRYRGYPIEQLAEQSSFIEVCYLLLYGELPAEKELLSFRRNLTRHTLIHEDMRRFFEAFPPDAHPMAILSSALCGLSVFYQDEADSPETRETTTLRLLAKLPTIAAFSYRRSRGLPTIYPDNSLSYMGNFLRMMFGYPSEPYKLDPDLAKVLDVLLILHADHEQNCSTSTVRMVGSSQANLFKCITAGVCALSGALHGGANQKVLEMLMNMRKEGNSVKQVVDQAKDKNSGFKLFGFGHRVYKTYDPRAAVIKKYCDLVLSKVGNKDPLLDIAKELEEAALKDSYFIERKLYPNVDFYSGIIYRAMGFPTNMFTVLFAMGRLPGWIAHWKEMVEAPYRINRPRQIYTGAQKRDYIPVEKRVKK